MAAVTVFVDDAVLGRLPYLCVKTGAPAEGLLTVRTPVGTQAGLGVWWLLVLAGPLGWLGLFVIALMTGNGADTLTVQVPWTEAAQSQVDEAKRRRRHLWLACAGIAGLTLVVLGLGDGAGFTGQLAAVLLLAAAGVGIAAVVAGVVVARTNVDVRIDASRRWVTLDGVHPDFAHAVETSRSGRQPAAP